jgi:hypothetical protein
VVQCPNCGGYRVGRFERALKASCGERVLCALLILSWIGVIFGLIWLFNILDRDKKWKEQQGNPWYDCGYYCEICGYQWLQPPGEQPKVRNAPNLRQMGEQRLREEEERRRQEEEDLLLD